MICFINFLAVRFGIEIARELASCPLSDSRIHVDCIRMTRTFSG